MEGLFGPLFRIARDPPGAVDGTSESSVNPSRLWSYTESKTASNESRSYGSRIPAVGRVSYGTARSADYTEFGLQSRSQRGPRGGLSLMWTTSGSTIQRNRASSPPLLTATCRRKMRSCPKPQVCSRTAGSPSISIGCLEGIANLSKPHTVPSWSRSCPRSASPATWRAALARQHLTWQPAVSACTA